MKRWVYFAVIVYFLPVIIWWIVMVGSQGFVLSYENGDWGSFGSFIGGVLSPMFSLIGFIFIIKSIESTNKNHDQQINILQKQNRSDHLLKLLNMYDEKLNEKIFNLGKYANGKKIIVYNDHSKVIQIPSGTIKEAILEFQLNKDTNKQFTEQYINYIELLISNTQYCLLKIIDFALSIAEDTELEEILDLVEASADTQSTMAVFEINIQSMRYSNKSPLLERLVEINKKSKLYEEYAERYQGIIECLNKQQLTSQSSRPPTASAD